MSATLRRMIEIGIDARPAKEGADQVQKALVEIQIEIKDTRVELDKYDKEQDKVEKSSRKLAQGLLALVGGFSALQIIRSITRQYAEFEETLQTVGLVAGASEEQLGQLNEAARELGATTRYTANQAGEGLLLLARAGFDVNEQLAATPAVLNLAIAGALSLGESADFAANSVRQFGLDASETNRVVDTLVKTANKTNTDVRQLAEGLKYAGPLAGALGLSVEETAAALGVLADSGQKASLGGTNLRGTLSDLLNPTEEARLKIEEMVGSLEMVNPEANSLIDIFRRLSAAQLTATQATEIFGVRNAAAALILAQGVEKLESLTAANFAAAGTAQEFSDVLGQTLVGKTKAFTSALQELALQIGESLDPTLKGVLDTLTGTTRELAGFTSQTEETSSASMALAAGVRFAGTALALFVALRVPLYLAEVTAGLGTTTTFAYGLGRAVGTLNAALGPVGWLALGISAVVTGLSLLIDEGNDANEVLGDLADTSNYLTVSVRGVEHALARIARASEIGDMEERVRALKRIVDELQGADISITQEVRSTAGSDSFVDLSQLKALITSPQGQRAIDDAALAFQVELGRAVQKEGGLWPLLESELGRIQPSGFFEIERFPAELAVKLLREEVNRTASEAEALSNRLEEAANTAVVLDRDSQAGKLIEDMQTRFQLERELIGLEGENAAATKAAQQIRAAAAKENILLKQSEINWVSTLARVNYRLEESAKAAADALEKQQEETERLNRRSEDAQRSLEDLVASWQLETRLLGMNTDERELAVAAHRAEALARDTNITNIQEYVDAIQSEIRAQQSIRQELEQLDRLRRRREGQDKLLMELTDEVKLLDMERRALALSSEERDHAKLTAEFYAKALQALNGDVETASLLTEQFAERLRRLAEDTNTRRVADELGDTLADTFEEIITGTKSVEEAFEDMLANISRIIFQELVTKQLASLLGGLFFQGFTGLGVGFGGGSAQGNVFRQGSVTAFTNGGIADVPTYFPMSGNRVGLMGEGSVPEAIVPLPNGRQIPVELRGGGVGMNVRVDMRVSGVTDADSIKRSASQITRRLSSGIRRGLSA